MEGFNTTLMNEELVYAALQEVIDPELGINIVDLGLIYELEIEDDGIRLVMTLTTPGCPMHASFKQDIEATLARAFPDLQNVSIELVWNPPWTPQMISEEGRQRLGLW